MVRQINSDTSKALMSIDDGSVASIVSIAALSAISQKLVSELDSAYALGAEQMMRRGIGSKIPNNTANSIKSRHVEVVNSFNKTTQAQIVLALESSGSLINLEGEDSDPVLKAAMAATLAKAAFNKLRVSRKDMVISTGVYGAYNSGMHDSAFEYALKSNKKVYKTWQSVNDESVRSTHRLLDGQKVLISDSFNAGAEKIRYPKDPFSPPSMTINCRCFLTYST